MPPYQKFLIVASKKDKAGINITTQLSQFGRFKFHLAEQEVIHTENLDMEKLNQYDFIIFASRHESEKKEKTLSVHAPGNWRLAEFGGEKNKVCRSSAIFMKQIFERLNKNAGMYHMNDYRVTMEATHHGPLIDKPCIFIEIGSTEMEWTERRSGFVVAKTIAEAISEYKENPYNEVAIAIGGTHYCAGFNKIQLKSNIAISHVIPQYAFPITEEMVREAVGKTEEEVDFALLDWKGLGPAEERERIIKILNDLYIEIRRTSDVES